MSEQDQAPAGSDYAEDHIEPAGPDRTGGRDEIAADDTEGHARHFETRDAADEDDDTQGHARHF